MDAKFQPSLLCFQHCDKRRNIWCLRVPDVCPVCRAPLSGGSQLILPPVRVTSNLLLTPLPAALGCVCLLVRPSDPAISFLDLVNAGVDRSLTRDLHIGISNTEGIVYDMSHRGISRHDLSAPPPLASESIWYGSLLIPLELTPDSLHTWNRRLERFSRSSRWRSDAYDPSGNNCFDFVREFLGYQDGVHFCEQFVRPKVSSLLRLITVRRKLLELESSGIASTPTIVSS